MGEYREEIKFVLDDKGEIVSLNLGGKDLQYIDDLANLPPGRIIPGSRLGKIYTFEGNPTYRRCVKRFGKWW